MAPSMLATPPNSKTRSNPGGALPDLPQPIPFPRLERLVQDQPRDTQERQVELEVREERLRKGEDILDGELTRLERKERAVSERQGELKKAYKTFESERRKFEDEKREEQRRFNKPQKSKEKGGKNIGRRTRRGAGKKASKKAIRKSGQTIPDHAQSNADRAMHHDSEVETALEEQRVAYEKDLLVVREQARENANRQMEKRLNKSRARMEQVLDARSSNLERSDCLPSFVLLKLQRKFNLMRSARATQQEKEAFDTACRNAAQHHFGANGQDALSESWVAVHTKILHLDVLSALQALGRSVDDLRHALPLGH